MYRWFGFASGIVESSVMFKARCFFVMDLTMEVSMRSESTVSPFRYGLSRIMIDSSAVYAVIFFRSFVFLRINFSRLPFSRRARSFSCATSRRGADAASFEAKVNSAMFSADKVSRCAILSNTFMRVWPSGKAKASQAFIRGFESRHPLQVYASRRWVSVGGFFVSWGMLFEPCCRTIRLRRVE